MSLTGGNPVIGPSNAQHSFNVLAGVRSVWGRLGNHCSHRCTHRGRLRCHLADHRIFGSNRNFDRVHVWVVLFSESTAARPLVTCESIFSSCAAGLVGFAVCHLVSPSSGSSASAGTPGKNRRRDSFYASRFHSGFILPIPLATVAIEPLFTSPTAS